MENVTITQYKINACGFYLDNSWVFGTPEDTFSSFQDWIGGLDTVGESSTYTPKEDDGFLRAFCLDIREIENRNALLIVTWNELERVDEGVQVVEMNSKIGHAEVSAVEIEAMALPGYPAFFIIEPENGRILNLRFEHRLNGSRQFQRFIKGFLATSSGYCVWDVNDDEKLLGYRQDQASEILDGAEADFTSSRVTVPGKEAFLRQHCADIRKVIRRASVSPQVDVQKSFLDSAFILLGLKPNNRLRADIPFEYEFKTRLTEEKLEAIISEYEKTADDTWSDVGFTLARESSKVHWLSGSAARGKGQIDVARLEHGMIDVDSLVAYACKNYERLVAISLENE